MKAITLHRPWPFAIFALGKDYENRSWPPPETLIGQRVAIHAGKAFDDDAADWLELMTGQDIPPEDEHPTGMIGTVLVTGVATQSSSRWFSGPFGWHIMDARPYDAPITIPGKQGLWDFDEPPHLAHSETPEPPPSVTPEVPTTGLAHTCKRLAIEYKDVGRAPLSAWQERVREALEQARALIPSERRTLAWPNFLERYVIPPKHARRYADESERDASRRCCVYAIALRAYVIHQRTEFLSNCVDHAAPILGLDPDALPTFPLTPPELQAAPDTPPKPKPAHTQYTQESLTL